MRGSSSTGRPGSASGHACHRAGRRELGRGGASAALIRRWISPWVREAADELIRLTAALAAVGMGCVAALLVRAGLRTKSSDGL